MKLLLVAFLICIALSAEGKPWERILRRNPDKLRPRIVGGQEASEGQFPYMVSLQYTANNTPVHFCGASLINEQYVLSAGLCLVDVVPEENIYALVGWNVYTETSKGQYYKLVEIYIHENFDHYDIRNDISLAKLEKKVELNSNVQLVGLPSVDAIIAEDTPGVLSGWGNLKSYYDDSPPLNLNYVDVTIFSNSYCSSVNFTLEFTSNNVCAGDLQGGKGQCTGDSGGPLVSNGQQIGVVSWSEKDDDGNCAIKGYPGVFTRVSAYLDWIQGKIRK